MKALTIANILFALVIAAGVVSAKADGDKNRESSPILPIGDNDCYYVVPDGIDLSQCEAVAAPNQSQVVYFCTALTPDDGGVTVFCQDD